MIKNKALTIFVLITFLVLSYVAPYPSVFAAFNFIENEQVEMSTDEINKVVTIISKYKYYGDMSKEEQKFVCDFYKVEGKSVLEIEKFKITLPDSICLVVINKNFNFSPQELEKLYKNYNEVNKLNDVIFDFEKHIIEFNIDESTTEILKYYLIEGYRPANIIHSYVISIVTDIDFKNLFYIQITKDIK